MPYSVLVILHLLGSAVWIGGHVVLVCVVLPAASREKDVARIVEFERAFGRFGLAALAVQVVTGLWLTTRWIGDLGTVLNAPPRAAFLVAAKLALLLVTMALAAHATHRTLPELTPDRIRSFALHAWTVTAISVLMLVLGVAIRTGA